MLTNRETSIWVTIHVSGTSNTKWHEPTPRDSVGKHYATNRTQKGHILDEYDAFEVFYNKSLPHRIPDLVHVTSHDLRRPDLKYCIILVLMKCWGLVLNGLILILVCFLFIYYLFIIFLFILFLSFFIYIFYKIMIHMTSGRSIMSHVFYL